jgi:hypothetical protein
MHRSEDGQLKTKCEHPNFIASVDVGRIESTTGGPMRFSADVKINCTECGVPFRFIGLPAGMDLNGAATSVDATEARLTIAPKGQVWTALEGAPSGFSVRASDVLGIDPAENAADCIEGYLKFKCRLNVPDEFHETATRMIQTAIDRAKK